MAMQIEKRKAEGNILTDYVLPLLLQFVALVLFMMMHRISVGRGGYLLERVQVGDEVSSPTLGRFMYMLFAFVMFLITAFFANRSSGSESRGSVLKSFWLGIASGTFLWQSIGEDSWHFGVHTADGLVNASQLESISVVFILVVFLIFLCYVLKRNALSFGVAMTVCSFLCNWLGHYVMLGTYPFVHTLFEEKTWTMLSGCTAGGLILIGSIVYLIRKGDSLKRRLVCSTFTYIALGTIALSIMEV